MGRSFSPYNGVVLIEPWLSCGVVFREASCALSGLHSQTVIGLWCAMDRPSMSVRMIGEELAKEAGRRETTAGPAAAAAAAKADATMSN